MQNLELCQKIVECNIVSIFDQNDRILLLQDSNHLWLILTQLPLFTFFTLSLNTHLPFDKRFLISRLFFF